MIYAKEFMEQDKDQLFDMINEINEYDANFEGLDDIGRIEDYNVFLKKLEKWKCQEQINPNYSPQTTFGVFDDKKLVGGFVLRYTLKGGKYVNDYYDESLKKTYKRYLIQIG